MLQHTLIQRGVLQFRRAKSAAQTNPAMAVANEILSRANCRYSLGTELFIPMVVFASFTLDRGGKSLDVVVRSENEEEEVWSSSTGAADFLAQSGRLEADSHLFDPFEWAVVDAGLKALWKRSKAFGSELRVDFDRVVGVEHRRCLCSNLFGGEKQVREEARPLMSIQLSTDEWGS